MLSVFTLLFAKNLIFASNIGRVVYGVYTEIYNGVGLYNASAGTDNITFYSDTWNIDANYTDDKIEGEKSLQVSSSTYVSFAFTEAQNMSAYEGGRIYFSLKCPIEISTNSASIKIEDSSGPKEIKFDSSLIKRINSSDTGVNNNGVWQTYYIALSDFFDLDLEHIKSPLVLTNTTTDNEKFYLIDNVYWTKAPSATRAFTVTVKNRTDNQVTDNITWTTSDFRQSWTAAQQYIELDLDQESSNWTVSIYLNNSSATRKGLYYVDSDGSEIVLPMAWRVSRDLLPNSSTGDSLNIKVDSWNLLYDCDKTTPDAQGIAWVWPWAKFYDISDTSLILEDIIVWGLQGCHLFLYTGESWAWQSFANYYERKPKIYFAADCSNALGGLIYTATVVTELVYE